jgi:prepilin-type N-terminal cleavage/methylation domain-containing protein
MTTARSRCTAANPAGRGFTLIEVLVVVAIIALLLAILLPSLAAARNQAKVTICQANSKQIGTMIASYQAEYNTYVPLLYNYWANELGASYTAEQCWLSVALRKYSAQTRDLLARGPAFNPSTRWLSDIRTQYELKYMPAFYACPFQRDTGAQLPNPMKQSGPKYDELKYGGRWESYHTWMHTASDGFGAILKNRQLNSGSDSEQYLAKYTTITFNYKGQHRKWEPVRRKGITASPSEWTAVYCAQGEFTPFPENGGPTRRANVGSHRVNGNGGTNTIFADTHVEWVRGKNIGRP